jgi:hypothetical protein
MWAGRDAYDHRAFDGKEPLIVIGDDEEERFARSVVGHRLVSHDSQMRGSHAETPAGNGLAVDACSGGFMA